MPLCQHKCVEFHYDVEYDINLKLDLLSKLTLITSLSSTPPRSAAVWAPAPSSSSDAMFVETCGGWTLHFPRSFYVWRSEQLLRPPYCPTWGPSPTAQTRHGSAAATTPVCSRLSPARGPNVPLNEDLVARLSRGLMLRREGTRKLPHH